MADSCFSRKKTKKVIVSLSTEVAVKISISLCRFIITECGAVALVQWLKLPDWKVRYRGLEPHSGNKVSKKQNVSSLLTRIDLILWESSVTEK